MTSTQNSRFRAEALLRIRDACFAFPGVPHEQCRATIENVAEELRGIPTKTPLTEEQINVLELFLKMLAINVLENQEKVKKFAGAFVERRLRSDSNFSGVATVAFVSFPTRKNSFMSVVFKLFTPDI